MPEFSHLPNEDVCDLIGDPVRDALREAVIAHNVSVVTSAARIDQIEFSKMRNVFEVLARYDAGEPIGST